MALRVCLLLYRKDFIAQAEKLTSSQCCEPKGAALGKFPGREITSAISHTHRFRWVREVASCPSLHLFRINVARFVKTSFTRRAQDEISSGILARRMR
jgi:hypothetical protein